MSSRRRCKATTITSLLAVFLILVASALAVAARNNKGESRRPPGSRHEQQEAGTFLHGGATSYGRETHRELGHHESRYYQFLNDDVQSTLPPSTLSDVWLCLACALGWTLWLVNLRQAQQPLLFEQRDSRKVMGHVLQISLGEDNLGTGIPVYHAIVDYVVDDEATDEEPLQIRKRFTSKKLLEEGFANVEILVLSDDPTTAILLEDFYEQKKERETQNPPSTAYIFLIHFVAFILIGGSVFGGVLVILRLEERLYGWVWLGVGIVLLYPAAVMLYTLISFLYSLAGPLSDRPGVIIHGKRFYCSKKCGALEALDIFDGEDDSKPTKNFWGALELSQLQIPSMEQQSTTNREVSTPQRLFPNGTWIQSNRFRRSCTIQRLTQHSLPTSYE
jgi:hypothetical protein